MEDAFWSTLVLTLQLAGITTLVLLLLGLPLAYWLAHRRHWGRNLVEALVGLPLVLPPTVLGFYLLVALGAESPLGSWLRHYFGLELIFSFEGLVLGSVVYSLPFMVQPLQSGFEQLSPTLREAAYTLGKSRLVTLLWVLLPNLRSALLSGIILTFAHTVGEFGVVLMIGGNLPGETRVASIAIFEAVETLNYPLAHRYAVLLVGLAFLALLAFYRINQQFRTWPNP